jgi:hypothetical protein
MDNSQIEIKHNEERKKDDNIIGQYWPDKVLEGSPSKVEHQ